jgi:RNA polymerase sigma factor (sigma-70 family)
MSADMVEEALPESDEPGDEVLLARFVDGGDQAAFRQLVERHAALVISVCRRGAPSPADADDAFQATFLVLAKAAHKVRKPASLAAWLYGVAYRVSGRLRRDAARRKASPLDDSMATHCDPLDELLARHEQAITDEELAALPESLRTPFVLRYLAGHSNAEVAEKLGTSVAAIEGRLKRAKQRLRSRLIRRGVTLAMAVAVLKATRVAAGEVPQSLVNATLETCFNLSGAAAAAPAGAQPVAMQLAQEEVLAMKALVLSKPLAAAILAGCVATFAVGVQFSPFPGREAGAAQQVTLETGRGPAAANAAERRQRDDLELAQFVAQSAPPAARAQSEAAFQPAVNVSVPVFDAKPRSEAEKLIAAALVKDSGSIEFSDQPLEEVVAYIRNQHKIPILFEEIALQEQAIGVDQPVSISVANVSLRSALQHILSRVDLTYIVKNEVMLITTPVRANAYLETRVYPCDDSARAESLANMLKSHVRPSSWAGESRAASWAGEAHGVAVAAITQFPGGLVVTQTYEGHEQIADLLKQLGWKSQSK